MKIYVIRYHPRHHTRYWCCSVRTRHSLVLQRELSTSYLRRAALLLLAPRPTVQMTLGERARRRGVGPMTGGLPVWFQIHDRVQHTRSQGHAPTATACPM